MTEAHRYVLEVTKSAARASEVVRAAWTQYRAKANADLRLLDLDKVVALIEAGFPTQLYYVPLRGSLFDTHVNQAAPHDRQLQYCADAIEGFFQEMQRIGRADDVVLYVHSEFGRRVPENTSLGTDHGTAQVNFVVGNAVKGGMYGKAGRQRLVPLNPHSKKALDEYLTARSTVLGERKLETRALFFSRSNNGVGASISVRSVARMLVQMTRERGLQRMGSSGLLVIVEPVECYANSASSDGVEAR